MLLGAANLRAHPAAFHTAEPETLGPAWQTALDHLRLGFLHIVPGGSDHVLFVLGLCLGASRWRALIGQLTAFTVAHSSTLALAALGWVRLPADVIEPLIALSIAYMTAECALGLRTGHRRVTVFGFGLLHGLGFAGALADVGLPAERFLLALLSFNLGVELGQLSVVAAAALALIWFRHKPWYGPRLARPASAVIAMIGLWWLVDRTLA